MVGIFELEFVYVFILSRYVPTMTANIFNKLSLSPFIMGKPRGKADVGFSLQSGPADKGS